MPDIKEFYSLSAGARAVFIAPKILDFIKTAFENDSHAIDVADEDDGDDEDVFNGDLKKAIENALEEALEEALKEDFEEDDEDVSTEAQQEVLKMLRDIAKRLEANKACKADKNDDA